MPVWSECRFLAFDQIPICYYRCAPQENIRGICLIIHGVGEHSARYRAVAEHLAQTGIYSYALDLRGFGRSGAKRGSWRGSEDFFRDIQALHALAISERKNHVPIYLLGHSFGALLSVHYAAFFNPSKDIDGLILSSPFFGLSYPAPLWKKILANVASLIFPNLTQSTQIQPEILTHDPQIIAQYKKDNLNHSLMSAGFYKHMMKLLATTESIAQTINLPTLILQAGQDKVASIEATKAFFKKLKSEDKKMLVFENDYHEILNETDRIAVLAAIETWLRDRLAF